MDTTPIQPPHITTALKMSESIKNIATALSKAQSSITFAVKNATNPFFKNEYADLGAVWEACRKPLTENGLAVSQFPGKYSNGDVDMTTILTHSSGEYMCQEMTIPVTKKDAQGIGSAITYARRYALAAVVGIYQNDDDGQGGKGKGKGKGATLPPSDPKTDPNKWRNELKRVLVDLRTDKEPLNEVISRVLGSADLPWPPSEEQAKDLVQKVLNKTLSNEPQN